MNPTNKPKNPQDLADQEAKATGIAQTQATPATGERDELSDEQLNDVAGGGRPKGGGNPALPRASSDVRLKHDIETVGKAGDLTLYRFKYKDDASNTDWVGVMAQDLLEHPQHKSAVITAESGFYQVDYQALGLEMVRYSDWLKQTRH